MNRRVAHPERPLRRADRSARPSTRCSRRIAAGERGWLCTVNVATLMTMRSNRAPASASSTAPRGSSPTASRWSGARRLFGGRAARAGDRHRPDRSLCVRARDRERAWCLSCSGTHRARCSTARSPTCAGATPACASSAPTAIARAPSGRRARRRDPRQRRQPAAGGNGRAAPGVRSSKSSGIGSGDGGDRCRRQLRRARRRALPGAAAGRQAPASSGSPGSLQEPLRLFPRYLVTNSMFCAARRPACSPSALKRWAMPKS